MKLRKVISGGQTGADRTGLECASALGLLTGGTAPQGFRTDNGPDPTLKTFGVVEHPSWSYKPRTLENVKNSDITLWFGDAASPGGKLTQRYCREQGKLFIENPKDLRLFAEQYEVWNIAGNRARTNPGVVQQVKDAFSTLKGLL